MWLFDFKILPICCEKCAPFTKFFNLLFMKEVYIFSSYECSFKYYMRKFHFHLSTILNYSGKFLVDFIMFEEKVLIGVSHRCNEYSEICLFFNAYYKLRPQKILKTLGLCLMLHTQYYGSEITHHISLLTFIAYTKMSFNYTAIKK